MLDYGEKVKLFVNSFSASELESALKSNTEGDFFKQVIDLHKEYVKTVQEANRYYINKTDFKGEGKVDKKKVDKKIDQLQTNPLRTADNKMCHNFHGILVNQKVSYLLSLKILLNTKNKAFKDKLDILHELLHPKLSILGIQASNGGVGWLYSYIGEKGEFKTAVIPNTQVIPFVDDTVDENIKYTIRYYDTMAITGEKKTIVLLVDTEKTIHYESSTNESFKKVTENEQDKVVYHAQKGKENIKFSRHPYVPFYNNITRLNDLSSYKVFIDAYDMVSSLYLNDIEDLQELIFVLINYGGTDLQTFLQDLKQYKAIKITESASGSKGGVETLKVDIPVEARIKFLDILDRNIWRLGQGVNPDPEKMSSHTGVYIKMLYSLLELKAGLMETQFREAINQVIEMYKEYLIATNGGNFTNEAVTQIYTRNMVQNEAELITMCKDSVGVISDETIIENHPWVESVEEEQEKIKNQKKAEEENYPDVPNGFGTGKKVIKDEQILEKKI